MKALLPELIILVTLFSVLSNRILARKIELSWFLSCAGLMACLGSLFLTWDSSISVHFFSGGYGVNPISQFFKGLITFGVLLVVIGFKDCIKHFPLRFMNEIYILFLFSLLGIFGLASSQNFLMLFISLELTSIPVYLLIAADSSQNQAVESSLKYFLLGSIASTAFLLGLSFIFPVIGNFSLASFQSALVAGQAMPLIFYIGIALMLVAVFFKISAFPFHFWAPDVYQGAPSLITGYMATIVKSAGFIFLYKIFFQQMWKANMQILFWASGTIVLTMLWSSIMAVRQSNLKRLLAFSGISHVGYILIGVLIMMTGTNDAWRAGLSDILFYMFAYLFMGLGAFAILAYLNIEAMSEIKGLGHKSPFIAAVFTLILISLAGFPPSLGFWAKIYLFMDAISVGVTGVVILACINTLIGAYYYFRIVKAMYLETSSDQSTNFVQGYGLLGVVVLCGFSSLVLGFFPVIKNWLNIIIR